LTHLHQTAWGISHQGIATIDALAGFAAVAANWHRHAAAHHQGPARHQLIETAAVWRSIRAQLTGLATLAQVDPALGEDVRAILRLLSSLRPRPGATELDLERIENSIRAGQVLTAGYSVFAEIALFGRTALAGMQVAGQVLIPAAALSRDEVSDDPALVGARLRRIWVPAQLSHIQGLLDAYDQAATDIGPPILQNEHPEV
jgi:hypothetical protein